MWEHPFRESIFINKFRFIVNMRGGETGIRTLGGVTPTTVFETAPFDRSGISPLDETHMRARAEAQGRIPRAGWALTGAWSDSAPQLPRLISIAAPKVESTVRKTMSWDSASGMPACARACSARAPQFYVDDEAPLRFGAIDFGRGMRRPATGALAVPCTMRFLSFAT
jgi:hypothetical protein